ncbi:hypothetical protein AVEN_106231-1 [Araneus ventricosus]|uniref:Endonuclease/exonuclease/phosphatase domain-containing protein n=1 Tax=Araneus ventricosus TaxID=182803 RepID=A0A4Y2PK20_ARAVE|nr:hypothetical protein AVEN_106231-1 [Araneus ventricosus]
MKAEFTNERLIPRNRCNTARYACFEFRQVHMLSPKARSRRGFPKLEIKVIRVRRTRRPVIRKPSRLSPNSGVARETTRTGSTPALPWQPGRLNDSRCNSSSTEARDLVAHTGLRPDPSLRRYVISLVEDPKTSPFLYPQGKRVPAYSSGRNSYPCTPGAMMGCVARAPYTAVLHWNRVSNLEPSGPKAETLPLGHRGLRENQDPLRSSGGTAILVKNNIPHRELIPPTLYYVEASVVVLDFNNSEKITLTSIYAPPSSDPGMFTFDIENVIQISSNQIICGYFNAHHISWGCASNNPRGVTLTNFVNNAGIEILAPSTPTRFENNSASTIDLAIVREFLYPYDIQSLPELSSDHNPVLLNFYFKYSIPSINGKIKTN